MGQTLTEIKNKIMAEILSNKNILRALIIDSPDFLTKNPSDKQLELLNNPSKLIRERIFPYIKNVEATTDSKCYITTRYINFIKSGMKYRSGIIYFYVLTPTCLENTDYGIRYDFIIDELEKTFSEIGIGDLEVGTRGDIEVDDGSGYIGGCINFKVIDFYGVK